MQSEKITHVGSAEAEGYRQEDFWELGERIRSSLVEVTCPLSFCRLG